MIQRTISLCRSTLPSVASVACWVTSRVCWTSWNVGRNAMFWTGAAGTSADGNASTRLPSVQIGACDENATVLAPRGSIFRSRPAWRCG